VGFFCLHGLHLLKKEPRKLDQPPPPAGYGVIAVEGASLDLAEHARGRAIFEISGQVKPGGVAAARVKTTTNNLAELVAFTSGLVWATHHPLAQQPLLSTARPVCVRYDSVYAAMVASGTWRAKKHKEMAAEAQRAWAALMKKTQGKLWLKHVKGHSGHQWNNRADRLADDGRHGKHRYSVCQ
jgi:ribonuclease HI